MSHFQCNRPKIKSFFPPYTCFSSLPGWAVVPSNPGTLREIWKSCWLTSVHRPGPQEALPLPALHLLSPTLSTIQVLLQAFITALLRDLSSLPLTPSSPEKSFYNANLTSCHSCFKLPFHLRQRNIQRQLLPVSRHAFHFAHILSYLQFPTKAMISRISVLLF